MVPDVLLFSSCHSKNFEPPSADNNVAHKLNEERKYRRRPQDEILCHRARAANLYQQAHA